MRNEWKSNRKQKSVYNEEKKKKEKEKEANIENINRFMDLLPIYECEVESMHGNIKI